MTSSPETPVAWAPQVLSGSRPVNARADAPAPAEDGQWSLPELPMPVRADRASARVDTDPSYEHGFADGMRAGGAQAEQRLRQAVEAAAQAAEALAGVRAEFARNQTRDLEALAMAVVEKIVQREVKADPTITRDLITRALELMPQDAAFDVRMNPTDLELVGSELRGVPEEGRIQVVQWVPDPSIGRGSFVLESPSRLVDGRIDMALRALYERLEHD